MEQQLARRTAAELGINVEPVVREFWEMAVLQILLGSSVGDRLVFKGGTALRLAYGSPRFSDDLGFSVRERPGFPEFAAAVRRAGREQDELRSDRPVVPGVADEGADRGGASSR